MTYWELKCLGVFRGNNAKYLNEKNVSNIKSNIVIIIVTYIILLTSNGNIILWYSSKVFADFKFKSLSKLKKVCSRTTGS